MNEQFEKLKALGAGDFQHLNGSLESHLKGTESILESWGASEILRLAGLFHAAYGTAGFEEKMVSLAQRKEIARVIGEEAEALVYLYCSCDRDTVFAQFPSEKPIQFHDRFSGSTFALDPALCRLFCELTVANELELVYESDAFKQKYGRELAELFQSMDSFLSVQAKQAYRAALDAYLTVKAI